MKTFWIQTLGCKVNRYESEQLAGLLRSRGLAASDSLQEADLCIVNTCSVTVQAASKSRQTVRRTVRLRVLESASPSPWIPGQATLRKPRVLLTGCWATSDRAEAERLPGVDAVLGHHDDVAAEVNRLLDHWGLLETGHRSSGEPPARVVESPLPPEPLGDDLSINQKAGIPAPRLHTTSKPHTASRVKENVVGTRTLPLLDERQDGHQRAFLKVQDGCDAHCTYCIIPQLRPSLWSKPIDDVVDEAKRLVAAGHVEIVLTGIFLGAYGQPTALRRRQAQDGSVPAALAQLITALCTKVSGLRRLRFSSLEPGDLTQDLLAVMRSFEHVVPHFHLPLQSGSDTLLRQMNRQYARDDFLRMIDQVNEAFDRPATTTDIIVGFPGETDAEFARTLDVVERVKFIHIHAFSFSPRPGTAAARWKDDFVHGPVVNERITVLTKLAATHSYAFRRRFLGETVELLVERQSLAPSPGTPGEGGGEGAFRHGRCERYFDVYFADAAAQPGDAVKVTIDRVTPQRTIGRSARHAPASGHVRPLR